MSAQTFRPLAALCLAQALILAMSASPSLAANSGGIFVTNYDGYGTDGYIGNNQSGMDTATASGGQVSIDSSFNGHIIGGYANSSSGTANATGNSVTISGGQIQGEVIGGYANSSSGTVRATGNSVNIMGAPVFGASSTLKGGYTDSSGGTVVDLHTDNTLNIFTSGVTVASIANFQNYNFALFQGTAVGLTLTSGTAPVDFQTGDVVRVPFAARGHVLEVGHFNILLSATTMNGLTSDMLPAGQARQGVALVYDYTLARNTGSVWATIDGVSVAPEGKSMSEGRAASLGFANLGADLIAGAGMDALRGAATAYSGKGHAGGSDAGYYGLIPFFAEYGSSLRYNTGSHTDVDGVALMGGLAKKWETSTLDMLAGVFVEAAFGNYETHNSFSSGFAKGKGDTRTAGGGILARLDMTDTVLKGLYTEASFRAGRLSNDYHNNNLRDFAGNIASYDINSTYYGAHAGLGYIWNFIQRASLDLYGKYFWTHQRGQDVTILGDKFSFKDADSHRTRLGARFRYAVTEEVTPYIGAAWEYEFDGKARATTYGYNVPAPSLKGNTGVGEVGLTWKPAKAQGFAVDLGLQGYTNQRAGISGTLQLKYEF